MHSEKTIRPIPAWWLGVAVVLLLTLAGCGGSRSAPTPTPLPRSPVPTFTPTPVGQEPAAAAPQVAAPAAEAPAAQPEVAPTAPAAPEAPTVTPVPPSARLTVTGNNINVRRGPSTAFGLVGTVSQGMSFEVLGRNQAGDWYQFCCVNGEQGWVFGTLVNVENAELVALAQNIPAPPAVVVQPAPQPAPTSPPAPPPPPAAADPCANIGGDGCKFKVTGGPAAVPNGGGELKLQLFFIHSGVDGGQPQGSYFIALEKDGQRVPIADSFRSVALSANQGPQGLYNYEYKVPAGSLAGGNVAGNYVGWVLDGNGERDSQNFSFGLGDGQGEVWIRFDQN